MAARGVAFRARIASVVERSRQLSEHAGRPLIAVLHVLGGGAPVDGYGADRRFGAWSRDTGFETVDTPLADAVATALATLRADCVRLRTEPIVPA